MHGEGRECPVGTLPPLLAGLFFTNVSFVSSQTWWPSGGRGWGHLENHRCRAALRRVWFHWNGCALDFPEFF